MPWGIPNSGPKPGRKGLSNPFGTLGEETTRAKKKSATSTGRNRDTVQNRKAGGGGSGGADPFPLSPADQTSLGLQRAALKYQGQITRASLRAQARQTRAMFQNARADINEQTRANTSVISDEMAERGLTGSTIHEANMQGNFGEREAALADARLQRTQGLAGVAQSRLEAIAQLRLGLMQIALQKAAQQRSMALQAFGSGGQNPWGY